MFGIPWSIKQASDRTGFGVFVIFLAWLVCEGLACMLTVWVGAFLLSFFGISLPR